ncbi:MAG: hypothetical protein EA391_05500 [Balneolaceae bacterium]|nr:MAG: hypothetical protein EA391_05500 [Balneolaceae bacterium]
MYKLKVLVTLFCFYIFGCTNDPSQFQNENDGAWTETVDHTIPIILGIPSNHSHAEYYRHASLPDEVAKEAQQTNIELLLSGQEIVTPVLRLIKEKEPNWPMIEMEAKRVFIEYSDAPSLFLSEQLFAAAVQRALIPDIDSVPALNISLEKELTDEERSVLTFSAELLLKNETPNADVIALNITLLEGFVSETMLREFAEKAVEHSMNWYGINRFESAYTHKEIADVKFRQVFDSVEFLKKEFLN